MNYNLVSSQDFTTEQKEFVKSSMDFTKTGGALSTILPELGIYIKDINSKYIMSTDYWANLVGLSCGADIIGLSDHDLPCEISKFAQDFIEEDKALLSYKDGYRRETTLNVGKYATGIESFISYKYPFKHDSSQSILGVTCTVCKVDISYVLTTLSNYLLESGGGSIQSIEEPLRIGDTEFTEREHKIGFLMGMNWDFEHIASFMNKHQPLSVPTTIGMIDDCQNKICQKLNCSISELHEKLIAIGFYRKMPTSFLTQLIGNKSLS